MVFKCLNPVFSDREGVCVEQCQGDRDCAAGEKCVSNGCGHVCSPAPQASKAERPARCPGLSRNICFVLPNLSTVVQQQLTLEYGFESFHHKIFLKRRFLGVFNHDLIAFHNSQLFSAWALLFRNNSSFYPLPPKYIFMGAKQDSTSKTM